MARNPKLFLHNQTYELCFRTEEGLPLVSAPYMVSLLKGYLAAAQSMYPVTICHCVFMGNHAHLLIVVQDPEDVPRFCEYFKRESAHAINRLRGRVGKTVWANGYDSPVLLDAEKVIGRIVYFYANPVKADLVKSIDDYIHINSWSAFLSGKVVSEKHKRIPRDKLPALPNSHLTTSRLAKLAVTIEKSGVGEYILTFSPQAWIACFEESRLSSPEAIQSEILGRVRESEQRYNKERKGKILGVARLVSQPLDHPYIPKKRGKRMICLGRSKELRRAFISFFKSYIFRAKELLRSSSAVGSASSPLPSLFSSSRYLNANLTSWAIPLPLA